MNDFASTDGVFRAWNSQITISPLVGCFAGINRQIAISPLVECFAGINRQLVNSSLVGFATTLNRQVAHGLVQALNVTPASSMGFVLPVAQTQMRPAVRSWSTSNSLEMNTLNGDMKLIYRSICMIRSSQMKVFGVYPENCSPMAIIRAQSKNLSNT